MGTPQERVRQADRLWAEYSRTHDPRTRAAIIHQFERLAYSIAGRFARPGMQDEDLRQVALVGLVKAVDRFDPTTRHRFSSFATPTIMGEIRHYFRDQAWSLHVPRSLQELAQRVRRATTELADRLGRAPTPADLAAYLELPEDEVTEALSLEESNRTLSLDREFQGQNGVPSGSRPSTLEAALGAEDPDLARAEDSISVHQALTGLGEPLRRVIELRYLAELSQREVGRRLGVSAMTVCRMEKQALSRLRHQFAVA